MAALSLPHVEITFAGDSVSHSRLQRAQAGRLGNVALRHQLSVFTREKSDLDYAIEIDCFGSR
jgi:hypothetical protein